MFATTVPTPQDEMKGRGYRVDVTQTYIVNTDFLAQAKKVEQSGHKMLVQRPTGHDSARQRLRRLHHSTAHEMSVASHSGQLFCILDAVVTVRSIWMTPVCDSDLSSITRTQSHRYGGEGGLPVSGSAPSLQQQNFPPQDTPASPETFVLKGAESVADYLGHIGVGGVVAPWAPHRGQFHCASL
jgi:hypothetical protein